ncbi:hypothetical protein CNMCM7691_002781 [Aspergillus felis]|uniref:Zn(2)-C6 fungal-type domain-containing protein n=1 Tax=Aspergillus felis TaxID=1287682 RepID=A0A8H6QPH8_9EURO|nr:hypothetical protein CNMCM7691_002781 [Aspergillus felis]
MDTTTTTSSTIQSPVPFAGSPARRKLRDSCNRCAASKIKCSKEKPICARCAKQGKPCEYFVTKRAGRKPGTRVRNPISPSPPVMQQSWLPATQTEPEVTQPSADTPSTESYSDLFSASFASADPSFSTQGTVEDILNFYIDDFTDSSQKLPMIHLPGGDNEFDSLHQQPSLANFDSMAALLSSNHAPSIGEATASPGQPTNSSCSFVRTITLLNNFPSPATRGCSAFPVQINPSTDTVKSILSANEQTVQAINEMLQCDCADGYLLAVLSIILLKTLSSYAAVVRQTPNLEAEHSIGVDPPSLSPLRGELGAQLDEYGLDSEDHIRLVGQQVLSQLHRVQRLVNLLSQRTQTVGGGGCGAPLTPPSHQTTSMESLFPFPAAMLDQMEANLRKRLRDLSAEILDLLR